MSSQRRHTVYNPAKSSSGCVLDCGGQPCSCQPGDSQACDDIGQCKNGVRRCQKDGTYGACEYLQGPSAERCDGVDNDCNQDY
jgi:hypothetical protein